MHQKNTRRICPFLKNSLQHLLVTIPEGNFCWRWKPRKGQWLDKTHRLPCTRRKHTSCVGGRGGHRGMVWNNWLHYSNGLVTNETYGNATAIFIVDGIPRILMTRWPFAKVVGNHSVSPWNTIDGIAETAKWIWANNTETTVKVNKRWFKLRRVCNCS